MEDVRGVAVTTGTDGEDGSGPVSIVGSIDGSDSSSSSSSSESSERDSWTGVSPRQWRGVYRTHVVCFCDVVYAGFERAEQRLVYLVVIVLVALAVGGAVELEVVDRFTLRVAVGHVKVLVG